VGEINNNTGTFTIDSADDIILDAAGNDVILKDNGTTFGQLTNDSGNLVIYNSGSQMLKGLGVGSNAQFMGNVGIGTASPQALLHLNSASDTYFIIGTTNSTADGRIQFRNSAGTDIGGLWYNTSGNRMMFRTNSQERMRIDSSGNVGIGTGSAALSARFHAYTTGYPVAKFERYGSSAATRGWTQIGHSSLGYSGATGADTYIVAQHGFGIAINEGTNAMTITDGGLVGIGTSNPDEKLVVSGDGARIYVNSADFHIAMIGRRGSSGTALDQGYLRLKDQGTNKVVLDTAGDSYLTGGNVGIGTTSPGSKLDVEAGALGSTSGDATTAAIFRAGRQNLVFKDTRTANGSDWNNATFKMIAQIDSTNHQSIDFVNDSNFAEHIDIRTGNQVFNTRFHANGNVGIKNTSPGYLLDIGSSSSTTSNIFRGTVNGDFIFTLAKNNTNLFSIRNNSTSIVHLNTQNNATLALGVSSTNNTGTIEHDVRIFSNGTMAMTASTAGNGSSIFSTGDYASGQGDNKTHFGYNASGTYNNYIRGANTIFSGSARFDTTTEFQSTATFTAGNRPVVINGGAITMQGETGGWAFGLHALGSSGTNHGGFGFLGGDDNFSYYYIGEAYNSANNFRLYKNGTLQVGGTTILDSSKNITNINTATISSSTSMLLTLNPTANNYGGIAFQYGGSTKGTSIYNSGAMVYGGEASVHTYLQAGGQYGLAIQASSRNVSIGSTSSFPQKLYVNGNIRADGAYYVGGLAVIDSNRNVANVASVTIDNNNNDYNFKAKAGSSNSWFGVYDDTNDSANIIVTRSNNVESFKHMGHTGETVIKATGTGLRIESSNNEAIQISGNGGGLNFQTGSNQRIYFNSQRAMEGNSTGTNLQIGESYSLINLQANTVIHGNLTPNANNTYDLGSSSQVWRDLYIGDLNLNNETRVNDDGTTGNEIDGTTGNWTVQEGEEHLYLINNKNGKKYKFALEEIE
jgi:hypothetical protein